MPEAGLVLGFVGDAVVHKDNSRALLADLIAAYKRDHKNAKIRFLLVSEPYTETMGDLADFCTTSGYQLGLVGTKNSFDSPEWAAYQSDVVGNLYPIMPGTTIAKGMVGALSIWDDARLILVADDPSEDDVAYTATVTAAGMGIKVRSLLHGLDEVLLEESTEEDAVPEEVEPEDEYEPEEDGDELPPEDEDVAALAELADDPDDPDTEAQERLSELAREDGLEPEDYDTWADVAEAIQGTATVVESEPVGAEDEDGYYDVDAEPEYEDTPVPDIEPEDEVAPEIEEVSEEDEDEVPPEEEKEETVAKQGNWTEASLNKLAEKDKNAFYAAAAEHDVFPGRGQKVSVMIRKILEAQDGVAPAKKAPAAKKAAPVKKAAKKAPAPAKKAPAAKKTAALNTAAAAIAATGFTKKQLSLMSKIVAAQAALADAWADFYESF